jgi:hypothetical protein
VQALMLLPQTLVLLAPLFFAFGEAIFSAINEARPVTKKLGTVGCAALTL